MERSDEARRKDALYDRIGRLERLNRKKDERIKELEDSDGWREFATKYYENGGCPICFSTDEAGCKEGCYLGEIQQKIEDYEDAFREIVKESGNINKDEWPTQQQKCFVIAEQVLKGE